MNQLQQKLRQIDGRGYPAYKGIKGSYHFERFALDIVHVQGDPFAAPSRIAVRVGRDDLDLTARDIKNRSRRTGLEDGMTRSFREALCSVGKRRGSGKSGDWGMLRLGQEILPRTACEVDSKEVVLRFTIGLPAAGRRILAREAIEMFFDELPAIVERGLFQASRDPWREHADAAEDQDVLRARLLDEKWVGFVANGSVLPRRSGVDDRPLEHDAVPWESPPGLEVEVEFPNAGRVKGTAFREGVTLICGGGYHGKSTLLQALTRSVYNHIPGDGRERCVAVYEAVGVRAEDGRAVSDVDISGFICNLHNGKDTVRFRTENASGSTSQAANIAEALELDARCLLIDEDTSATNFMVRDRRMQELIVTEQEPIAPFIDRVRELYDAFGVSTMLVVGGAGDYFDVADHVLALSAYRPRIVTDRAREIASQHPSNRQAEERPSLRFSKSRIPTKSSFDARRGRRPERVRARETRTIEFGAEEIEVSLLPQLVDEGQTRLLGDWLIRCSRGLADGKHTIREICQRVEGEALDSPLSETTGGNEGNRVFARRFEFAAAINCLRTLKVTT